MKLSSLVRHVVDRSFLIAVLRTVAAMLAAGTALAGPAFAAAAAGEPVGGPRLGGAGLVLPAGAPALPRGLSASSWLVADLDTGAVLAARNPHGCFAPASTLKILTAETLIPLLDPRAMIVVTDSDARVDGTRVGLVPKQRVGIDTLFAALLVVSANDAALTLSRAVGGTPVAVRRMDAEARHLGAFDTVPKTVDGLDAPGQSSSAYDLALISRAAMRLPAFRRYVAIRLAQFPAPRGTSFQIYTHNPLLIHYPGAVGIKNGHTDAALSSFVGAARRGGHTLVVTLMHAKPTVWREAAALLSWGFAAQGRTGPVGQLVAPGSVPAVRPSSARPPSAPPPALSPAAPRVGAAGAPAGPRSATAAGALAAVLVAGAGMLAVRRRQVRQRRRRRVSRGAGG